jgi:hypothetical protein
VIGCFKALKERGRNPGRCVNELFYRIKKSLIKHLIRLSFPKSEELWSSRLVIILF